MNKLQQTYFFRLFKENKWLFVFVLLFIVCQHFFYLKKNMYNNVPQQTLLLIFFEYEYEYEYTH